MKEHINIVKDETINDKQMKGIIIMCQDWALPVCLPGVILLRTYHTVHLTVDLTDSMSTMLHKHKPSASIT